MAEGIAGIDFSKQVGPLPLGAWVVVVGTGLGIAYYTRSGDSGGSYDEETPVIVEDISGTPGVGNGSVGGWFPTSPVVTPQPATPVIATNEEWGASAINALIASGYDSAAADNAIRKYLAGSTLNPVEIAIVRIALNKLGSPPVPLPPSNVVIPPVPPVNPNPPTGGGGTKPPPPKPPPPKPKPQFKYYTVKPWPSKASTLGGIAELVYKNPKRWPDIYNANRAGKKRADGKVGLISNPNSLRPGMVLLIP